MLFKFRKNLKTVQNKNYDTYDADEKMETGTALL
jgi:hypothetical protein